jgi:hypothetical protein
MGVERRVSGFISPPGIISASNPPADQGYILLDPYGSLYDS